MSRRRHLSSVVILLVCLAWPVTARAQFTEEGPIFSGPGFFSTSVPRGPFVIIPTLTIAEEYNDNLFLNNANRRSDFVTHASPGLRVSIENPGLRVNAGYFFTAEKYAEQTQLDTFFRTQGLFADTSWQVTPLVALALGGLLT